MRREREWQRRFEHLAAAVREFAKLQDELERGNGCDGEAHTKAYRKMKRLTKGIGPMEGK